MDDYAIMAELLYTISNYEKGRIQVKKVWSKRYINSLKESIHIMKCIVAMMKRSDAMETIDIKILVDYVNKNEELIFSVGLGEKLLTTYETGVSFQYTSDDKKQEILQLMESILILCNKLLNQHKKDYKIKISYLLMALHNIPRMFFSNDKDTWLNIRISPLTFDEVRMCVHNYIELSGESLLN